MGATITMPIEEWQARLRERDDALDRAAKLERELQEAKLAGADPLIQILMPGFLGAYELVKFCIAHAHPEVVTTQPWPYEALIAFANALEKLPLVEPSAAFRQEAAIDMRHMAGEAADYNKRRAERNAQLLRGVSPDPVTTPTVPAVIDLPPIPGVDH